MQENVTNTATMQIVVIECITRIFFLMTHILNKLKIIVSWEDMAEKNMKNVVVIIVGSLHCQDMI